MAIYDQSYDAWSGPATGRLSRILAMVRPGVTAPFRNVWILIIVILAFVIVAAWLLVLLAVATTLANNPRGEVLTNLLFAAGNQIYRANFFNHVIFSMILTVLAISVGAPLISKDLQHNALLMYFSRAITRWDYLAGKFLTLVLFLLVVTLGPALILFFGQIAMGRTSRSDATKPSSWASLTVTGGANCTTSACMPAGSTRYPRSRSPRVTVRARIGASNCSPSIIPAWRTSDTSGSPSARSAAANAFPRSAAASTRCSRSIRSIVVRAAAEPSGSP